MLAIRKWLYKPKKSDHHPLGRFYFADLDLVEISKELDSFDGRQDPERCTVLVNRLRTCQDRVLVIIEEILHDCLGDQRASREFRAKFPDDVLQETLWGQLWFGAECLAAGSVILNREIESAALRPLARFLTRTIDSLRMILRDYCYKNTTTYSSKVRNALRKFDEVFAEFELSYVSAMVPVKTSLEYDTQQDVIVMFCETVERAQSSGLITQDEVDDYDAALMLTIPRLAILCGLVIFPEGPLNMDNSPENMSELFRPFYQLLFKIRQLLRTLTTEEVSLLEKALCSNEHPWEDIERQLNELHLSYEESGSYFDVHSYISPVESSVTECDTACSSVPSVSMLEDRLKFDTSGSWLDSGSLEAKRKLSLPPTGTSVPETDVEVCPTGHAKSEGINIPCQKKRRRRSQPPPVTSMESPEAIVAQKETKKHCSKRKSSSESQRKDSGGITDPLGEPLMNGPPCNGLDAGHNGEEGHKPSKTINLKREDSGLGTPSHCCSMETTSPEYPSLLDDFAKDCERGSPEESEGGADQCVQNLCMVPQQSKTSPVLNEQQELQPSDIFIEDKNTDRYTSLDGLNEGQQSKSSDIFRGDKNTNRRSAGSIELTGTELQPPTNGSSGNSFLNFGKGVPSTQLNMIDSIGTAINDVFDHESDIHSLMWATVDSSARTSEVSQEMASTSSLQLSRLRLRNPSGSSTGSNIQTTSGMNRVTGLLGLAGATTNRTGSTGSSVDSCGSSCSCCSSSDDEQQEYQWESDDSDSESSLTDNVDAREITLAIQAAEIAARQEVRSQFSSSSDLVHRLFVCISGVADHLQTNYASDLRGILKTVFEVRAENPTHHGSLPRAEGSGAGVNDDLMILPAAPSDGAQGANRRRRHRSNGSRNRACSFEEPPPWTPDDTATHCLACQAAFTVLRRKHHCRNCGKIFCARCSANAVPLPRYGQTNPVRVCNRCYMYQVTPFQP